MEQKLRLNNISAIVYQIVALVVGLVVPRMILLAYGSDVNGLVYSISQMLAVIAYFDFGISAVAQAALYKPISQKNKKQVSIIYSAVRKYFIFLTGILLVYIFVLCVYYGFIKNGTYSSVYTIALVLSIAISYVGQYLWGVSNQVLLAADQKIYIYTLWNIATTIINACATFFLIRRGYSVQIVKLVASMVFLIKPFALQVYVKKMYKIEVQKDVSLNVLPEKWSGLVQHIATTLTASLDTIVLTLVSTMSNVSIYNVYVFPLNGMRILIESIGSGYKSYLGHLLVGNDKKKLNREFDKYEIIIHFLATVLVCCSFKLLIPFVLLYTKNVDDANYDNYLFMIFITIAYFIMLVRIPYTTIVASAGHFKRTQKICIIEVATNLIFSFAAVFKYGLIGVAIGTCVAVSYKMIAFIYYLKKNILFRKISQFISILFIDILTCVLFYFVTLFFDFNIMNYIKWFGCAVVYLLVACIINGGVLFIFKGTVFRKMLLKK